MDNDTTVETFKYLNYCQLAKNSLVSKRFWDLIRTHRHKLALIYVDEFLSRSLSPPPSNIRTVHPTDVTLFNKKLSQEEYNEWVNRNQYSKHIPFEEQVAGEEWEQFRGKNYSFHVNAYYTDQSQRKYGESTCVFFASGELNNENWPVFQHLALLHSDPFAYIRNGGCFPNVFMLMTRAMNLDRNLLRYEEFVFTLENNAKKFISWIKEHMSCKQIIIYDHCYSTYHDEELLDFFVSGAHCTSEISITFNHDVSKIVVDLVQKFMDMKNCDEYRFVESITGFAHTASNNILAALKRNYPKFMFKEDGEDDRIDYVFKCVNNGIGKQLKHSITNYEYHSHFSLKIDNL